MDEARKIALAQLLANCGVTIEDISLINVALTHPTYVFENRHLHGEHNQRLEFLGDAVLGLLVGEHLYRRFPQCPEGDLTKMRATVVCENTLARKARQINLGSFLLLGKGEEMTGGRDRASILADVFEAVTGALYLTAGLETARQFVQTLLGEEIDHLVPGEYGDFKTHLQEIVQRDFEENVTYHILHESGPDHDKRFVAGVFLQRKLLAEGTGRSKKEAEQNAARIALGNLNRNRQCHR